MFKKMKLPKYLAVLYPVLCSLYARKWNCWRKWINQVVASTITYLSWVLCCHAKQQALSAFKLASPGSSTGSKNRRYSVAREYLVDAPETFISNLLLPLCFLLNLLSNLWFPLEELNWWKRSSGEETKGSRPNYCFSGMHAAHIKARSNYGGDSIHGFCCWLVYKKQMYYFKVCSYWVCGFRPFDGTGGSVEL